MAESKIEWTDATWNPVVGCTWASPGCDNCYAATMSRRLEAMGQADYAGLTTKKHFNGVVRTLEHRLDAPLHWRKPRMVFVNSMSDLFHKSVPFAFIDKVFCIMALTPQHTYQVLTKRPERMWEYLTTIGADCREMSSWDRGAALAAWCVVNLSREQNLQLHATSSAGWWEHRRMPNVWLGTSVENQTEFDRRASYMGNIPATVRFLSIEPMLEPIKMRFLHHLQWIIVGGESGHGARPCEIHSIRSIVAQCKEAGIPCFVKQLGANCVVDRHIELMGGPHSLLRKKLNDKKGGDWSEWPEDLRVREFPLAATETSPCTA